MRCCLKRIRLRMNFRQPPQTAWVSEVRFNIILILYCPYNRSLIKLSNIPLVYDGCMQGTSCMQVSCMQDRCTLCKVGICMSPLGCSHLVKNKMGWKQCHKGSEFKCIYVAFNCTFPVYYYVLLNWTERSGARDPAPITRPERNVVELGMDERWAPPLLHGLNWT